MVSLEMVDGLSSQLDAFSSSSFRMEEKEEGLAAFSVMQSLVAIGGSMMQWSQRIHPSVADGFYKYQESSDKRRKIQVSVQDFGAGISIVSFNDFYFQLMYFLTPMLDVDESKALI